MKRRKKHTNKNKQEPALFPEIVPIIFMATFYRVSNHMNWTSGKTLLWFLTKNPHFGNLSPIVLWMFRTDKCKRIINGLIDESKK